LNIFYDSKFDCGPEHDANAYYELKIGFDSPHTATLDLVPAGAKVLDLGCAGGYLSKIAKDAKIFTIICSFGEQSHPHLKEMEISKTRVEESEAADKLIGGNGVHFLGLREGNIIKDFDDRGFEEPVIELVKGFNPTRILTHSQDDPHPDHRAVHHLLLRLHEKAAPRAEIFTFDVWNLFNLKRRTPRLVVDITHTFKRKIDALKAFKSQRTALAFLLWSVYVRGVWWGFRKGTRYAEVFYRIR